MMAPRPSAAALCCLVLGIALLQLAGAQDSPSTARPAAAFCASSAAKQATCGWASIEEQSATYKPCLWCGTVWRGAGLKPSRAVIEGHRTYWQYAGNVVSLGCQPGKLVVRAVFKPTEQNGNSCVRLSAAREGSLASGISDVTRCELQLPPGDEFEAALKSKEVNCKPCRSCNDCNTALNKWYSDTFTVNWEGCAGVTKAGAKPYEPFTPAMIINPQSSTVVAKFEVQHCSQDPLGCS